MDAVHSVMYTVEREQGPTVIAVRRFCNCDRNGQHALPWGTSPIEGFMMTEAERRRLAEVIGDTVGRIKRHGWVHVHYPFSLI